MRKWNDELWLFTKDEFDKLPNGTELTSINGHTVTKGTNNVDMDVRFGHIAYGIKNPHLHKDAELFSIFRLS